MRALVAACVRIVALILCLVCVAHPILTDHWVTKKGMDNLMRNVYPNLKKTFREIKISESEKGEIGHINFFRSYNKNLWNIVLEKL